MSKIKSNPHKTTLTISLGLIVVFLVLGHKWAIYSALLLSLISLASKKLALLVEKFWFRIAEAMGLIIPNVILALIFYLLLFPTSILSKIFKNTDNLILKNKTNSTYKKVNKKFTEKDFINPF
jgi:hypothetical protein